MSPKRLPTRPGDRSSATARLRVSEKYLEAAQLMAMDDDPYAINVCVGTAVLGGIAAGDAICVAASGARYSGQDHHAAADLLESVDSQMGRRLKRIVGLKSGAHYGEKLLSTRDWTIALRDVEALVQNARDRLS